MPPDTVYVGRPTKWGNPFNATQVGTMFSHYGYPAPIMELYSPPSLERCIDLYTAHLATKLIYEDDDFLSPLTGKNLCCWCSLDQLCHADVLLRIANEPVFVQQRLTQE